MDDNLTDQQQVELLKKMWKEYGIALAAGCVTAILIAFGFRFYQHHRNQTAQAASVVYERLVEDSSQNDLKALKQEAAILISDYPHSPYATFASLFLAKIAVEQHQTTDATAALAWVIQHSSNSDFRQIARIRLARLYLSENQPEQALTVLETVENEAFGNLISEIQGDVYLKMERFDEARSAYTQALNQLPPQTALRTQIQMKLDNLPESHPVV